MNWSAILVIVSIVVVVGVCIDICRCMNEFEGEL